MKKHILLMSALMLISDFAPALAQTPQNRPGADKGHARPAQGSRPAARPTNAARPVTRPAPKPPVAGTRPTPARPGKPQVQPVRPGRPGANRPRPPVAKPTNRPHRPGAGRPPHRPGAGRPPHRPGAGRPPNFRPVHASPYRYPRGHRYRRWVTGVLLPSALLLPAYYYNQYGSMGLYAPPPGYRWVRYGPDLLLVQIGTRRIADVIYGAFY